MKFSHFALCCFLSSSIGINKVFAQHKNIEISRIKSPNEISIAINPSDNSKMLAAANIASLYTTINGGLHWQRKTQESSYGVWGDPVVAIDSSGRYFHFHLSRPDKGFWIDRIVCQMSDDEGKTFNNGSFTGFNPFPDSSGAKAQDKHWVAIDPSAGDMYLTWTQFDVYGSSDTSHHSNILFSKSKDFGESWSHPLQINAVSGDCLDDDNTVEGAMPAVGPSGQLYAAWSGPDGLVFNRSFDGGTTWMESEQQIASLKAGWSFDIPGIFRANGLPVTLCDVSGGTENGTIYINWADQETEGINTDIWLITSKDQGNTWSEPKRVNGDNTSRHQFFTWMAIDQSNGNLYWVYHDRRDHSDTATDLYLAWSDDGGLTVHETKITDDPFLPTEEPFFGDYNNIAALNGVVRPVWTRLDGKKLSVWTAIIETEILEEPKNLEMQLSKVSVGIEIKFAEAKTLEISLSDLNGKTLKNWEAGNIGSEGKRLEIDLETGIYKVVAKNGSEIWQRQLIVD